MTVVILDTNSLPHGHYSERALVRLIEIAGRGASIVVPEVVLWEWAEHARASQMEFAETVRQHRVDAQLVTKPKIPEIPSIDGVIASIRNLLNGRATIWSPAQDVWREAVRQQVLQIGSGETKKDVKTGAADAVVFACVASELETAEGAVILLTSDQKLGDNCKKVFDEVLVASGSGNLLTQLNKFEPAEEDLSLRTEETLTEYLNENIADFGDALPFEDFGFEFHSGSERYSSATPIRVTAMQLAHIDIVETHGFQITRTADRRYGIANLRLFGDISILFSEQYETSPGIHEWSSERVPLSMAHIDVTVTTRWNHNWQLEGVEPTGVAVIVTPSLEDDDFDDEVSLFRAAESVRVD
ncbi:hypothetical protein AB4Y63_12160 [Leifsonia sp. YAF41]|uniref:hypothetical protein n=1 Tax=Leifsonia sp. YAF41 TaxID=3233086 RepID=UPI003F944BF2